MEQVFNQATVLFLLLLVGFIAKKLKIMTDELGKGISNLIIYIMLPALIITAMNYEFSEEMLSMSIKLLTIAPFVHIFMIILAILFTKVFIIEDIKKRGVYQFLIVFGNVGFMGYPIIRSIYGDIGVFYAAIHNIWFNILMWTVGIMLMSSDDKGKMNLKALVNPGIISIAIGFFLFIFSIELPEPISIALSKLGNATTPLSMMVVGSLIADAKIKEIFTNTKLIFVSIIKLVIVPLIVYLVLSRFDLPKMVVGIPVILSGMPSAANAAIYARKYDSDYKLASQGVFLTTLLCLITIPMLMMLLTI